MAFQLNAATIHYQATDLVDTTAGEDLWQYTYTLSEHSFSVDTGFSIFFDPALYSNLQSPAPVVNSDWDILVYQPAPLFAANGVYDAFSLIDNPSILDSFSLSFVWQGLDSPESQDYAFYDASFNITATGITLAEPSASIPAPPALWLLTIGLFGLLKSRKSSLMRPK